MSGIGGFLRLDGQPMDPSLLDNLDIGLRRLGPDGRKISIQGEVGFIYRAFNTTHESWRESQPYRSGSLTVCFDGRLDNRSSLIASLPSFGEDPTDVEIISAAYSNWGESCFKRFLGDFSIVIWHGTSGTLTFARDPFGIRSLFYTVTPKYCAWASTPDALLAIPDMRMDLDEIYVALFLAFYPDGERSPFRNILPLGPGKIITVGRSGVLSRRPFWDPQSIVPKESIVPANDYFEQFSDLFLEAVNVRLRADTAIIAELSGGLDSSSIVCAADSISNDSNGIIPKVSTLSYVFDRAKDADERQFIAAVEHQRGIRGIHLLEDLNPVLSGWLDPKFISFPNRDLCFGGLVSGKLDALASLGSRVILSGTFGDQVLAREYGVPELAGLFRRGDIIAALRLCLDGGARLRRRPFDLLWKQAIRPNLPRLFRPAIFEIPSWLSAPFVKRTDLRERVERMFEPDVDLQSGVSRFPELLWVIANQASGYVECQTTFSCVEVRYPFLHRPLVEFVLGLPTKMLDHIYRGRSLQRNGLAGILPPAIRARHDKKGPVQAIIIAIEREWSTIEELIRNSRACAHGFVDADELRKEFQRTRHGLTARSDVLKFITIEMWLRSLEVCAGPLAPSNLIVPTT